MNKNVVAWRSPIGGFAAKLLGGRARFVSSGLCAINSSVTISAQGLGKAATEAYVSVAGLPGFEGRGGAMSAFDHHAPEGGRV
jgi:hypothetical protein